MSLSSNFAIAHAAALVATLFVAHRCWTWSISSLLFFAVVFLGLAKLSLPMVVPSMRSPVMSTPILMAFVVKSMPVWSPLFVQFLHLMAIEWLAVMQFQSTAWPLSLSQFVEQSTFVWHAILDVVSTLSAN